MATKPKRKGLRIFLICLLVCAMAGFGAWYWLTQTQPESVNVFPFTYIGMTEYWGDTQESYGPVTTENIQTVFLSPTQTVTEISVKEGDTVKKGDLLMTYDTTLTDIALERERLKVEKLKLDLQDAYEKLAEIKAMKPMVLPEPEPEQTEPADPGAPLSGPYAISTNKKYDGTARELALICWLSNGSAIDNTLLDALRQTARQFREENGTSNAPQDPALPEAPPEDPTEPAQVPNDPTQAPAEVPTEPASTEDNIRFYVVFKSTDGDTSLAEVTMWQGMCVTWEAATGSYRFWLYDAADFPDHTLENPQPEEPQPEIDMGSGYTAAQIAQMRDQQEKTIRELQFQVKMAEADYKIKQTEISDGNVYAQLDGTVVSLLPPEEATATSQPLMKVSSGGGFYVEGSVSELQKENLLPGQEVTVNDWNTGATYTGIIESVADYPLPSDGGMYGNGNPNVSFYPFTVFVDGSADLQAGAYVSVMFSAASMESGIYLENPYLRAEQGKHYVFVRGEDGLLEKRYVTTGKSLWGSYTEILAGISSEDLLAFPYGKSVKEGAPTVESDLSALYG